MRRGLSGKGQEGTFWGDGNTVCKLNLNLRNKTLYVRQTPGALDAEGGRRCLRINIACVPGAQTYLKIWWEYLRM